MPFHRAPRLKDAAGWGSPGTGRRKRQPASQHSFSWALKPGAVASKIQTRRCPCSHPPPRNAPKATTPPPVDSDIQRARVAPQPTRCRAVGCPSTAGERFTTLVSLLYVSLDFFSTSSWQSLPCDFLICLQIRGLEQLLHREPPLMLVAREG